MTRDADNRTTEITLDDMLEGIVGQHYPQGDTTMDDVSMGNMPKLEAIAKWMAYELSCGGRLDGYLNSPCGSIKSVALEHDKAIMELLEWFEPQVKRYYETWLAGNGDD